MEDVYFAVISKSFGVYGIKKEIVSADSKEEVIEYCEKYNPGWDIDFIIKGSYV